MVDYMLNAPKMKTKKDCGLTAMSFVSSNIISEDYDKVYNCLKSIMEYDDVDLDDNPAEHERVINEFSKAYPEFNLKYSLIEPISESLFSGKLPNNRTIILVHRVEEDKSHLMSLIFGLLNQHWCVLHSVHTESRHVVVWWLDGTIKSFSFDLFSKMLTITTPQCVYTIGESPKSISNPWYSKLYAFIVNMILKIFRK